ncbi:hypothetical protein NMG60_11006347 [Bertholletia excelsa]
MAAQTMTSTPPTAQVVGNAFVEQYYHILHHSPELVHRFYQDSSVISRLEPSGVMASATTMKDINDKICSLDYKNCKAEIRTADAQDSYKDGVIVLVTGCLTGTDNIRRKFTQTFFLAPQDKGYFVLNDVFRYVEDSEPLERNKATVNGIHDAPVSSQMPDPEPVHVFDPPMVDATTSLMKEVPDVDKKAHDPINDETQQFNEKEVITDPEPRSNRNDLPVVPESVSSIAQEGASKKSYASIVSSQTKKGASVPAKVYVPANAKGVTPTMTEKQSVNSEAHPSTIETSVPSASGNDNVLESGNLLGEAEGHSIYIRNLPLNVTVAHLEVEFKKFGPIKQGGVQVRSNKQQGFCFGFVEFQNLTSMSDAIKASPITIGDRQAVIELKRTTNRVGNGRGGLPSGRGGGYRSDSFRGRGHFGRGVRGYGRNEYGSRGEFSIQVRGPGRRSGEGYQQGRSRGGRRGGPIQNTPPS